MVKKYTQRIISRVNRRPFSKGNLSEIPSRSGVYALLNNLSRIVRIGKAKDLYSRLHIYKSEMDRGRNINRGKKHNYWYFRYWETDNMHTADILEVLLINKYRPIENVNSIIWDHL